MFVFILVGHIGHMDGFDNAGIDFGQLEDLINGSDNVMWVQNLQSVNFFAAFFFDIWNSRVSLITP